MTKTIKLARELELPLDAVTQKLAWLGRTGSGKTYGAKRMVEEMLRAGAQVVVLDPVGVWAGLRLGPKSFDVPVLGGLYGDIPLEPTAGALIADLVVDHGTSMVLDVSQMLDAQRTRFAAAFAGQFFQRKKAAPAAVHLALEECQDFVPQNHQAGEELMLHEFQRIAKQGRSFGIGLSLISQRPQEVNKKALNQAECVLAFQMTGPQERKALEYWLSDKGFEGKLSDILPRLEVGAPHVWSPQWLKISKVVHILPIDSLDTSSTPKVGEKAFAQKKLKSIDLAELSAAMAETLERAKADDPKALRARIAELEEQLAAAPAAEPERVDVPVFEEAQINRLERAAEGLQQHGIAAVEAARDLIAALPQRELLDGGFVGARRLTPPISAREPAVTKPKPPEPQRNTAATSAHARPVTNGAGTSDEKLTPCERQMLTALAQHGQLALAKITILTGYSKRSSTPGEAASRLRGAGLVDGSNVGGMTITRAGLKALGPFERLPTGPELARHWFEQLTPCEGAILKLAITRYPRTVSLNQAREAANYSASSSTPGEAASKLRKLGLIVGPNAGFTASEGLAG